MYNITLPILGTRLKQIREHIGYSQAQLAEQLNCKQNAISNLELGKGGSLKLLFQVLNFYSNYVFIDLIFSEKFYLISNTEEDEAQKANYNSVIIEIIRQSEKNYDDAMSNAKKELEANLQKAINLLQPSLVSNKNGRVKNLIK
jgi:transcriptional regulator with XRE-family HTH domain